MSKGISFIDYVADHLLRFYYDRTVFSKSDTISIFFWTVFLTPALLIVGIPLMMWRLLVRLFE